MMSKQLGILFVSILLGKIICFPIDEDEENLIDLSSLGPLVFGNPDEDLGERLAAWTPEDGNPEELGSYVEGDILIPTNEQLGKNGLVATSAKWPGAEIPYVIRGSFNPPQQRLIQKAMNEYHTKTCVRFVPKERHHKSFISIESGKSGCWSNVGRIGGKQVVNLQAPSCVTMLGTVLHELYHAVGFMHEQNREDRDSYVSIQWNNIPQAMRNNFEKADSGSTNAFGVPYDYGSVMHYSQKSFSMNGSPTIEAKFPGGNKMGQREGFSGNDLLKINRMYNCGKSLIQLDEVPSMGNQLSDEIIPDTDPTETNPRTPEEKGRYFQGDIKIPPSSFGLARNGIVESKWENGIVPYTISKKFFGRYRREIMVALESFEMVSCVRFVPRKNEPDYVSIENEDDGCWSTSIGKLGGKQVVNIQTPGCEMHGSIVHELLHAVGFHHEQNREDRDEFVSIVYDNIEDADVTQFDKLPTGSSNTFGVPYDYGSVMHYSAYAFSKNDKATIVPLKPVKKRMGQRNGFANSDIDKLNKMYGCQQ